jgi:hypothetical protein
MTQSLPPSRYRFGIVVGMSTISLRLPADLHAALKAAAEADERSLNGEILWLLKAALAAR